MVANTVRGVVLSGSWVYERTGILTGVYKLSLATQLIQIIDATFTFPK